jgi:hypothetical protein
MRSRRTAFVVLQSFASGLPLGLVWCPLLFVDASGDGAVSRERAERLHAAGGEPREVLWLEAHQGDLSGRTLQAMWHFLRRQLLPSG